MQTRRSILAACGGIFGASFVQASPLSRFVPFTTSNAPDDVSRAILSRALTRLDEGGPGTQRAIHVNFPQIIEQNWARRDTAGAARLADSLTQQEWSDLAQLYVNATTELGKSPRLLNVLAHRLDASRLGRISEHFGFEPVYAAIVALAPVKVQGFLERSRPDFRAPVPGETRVGPEGRFVGNTRVAGLSRPRRLQVVSDFVKYWGFEPYEIYLDLRTAPVGSLGARAALVETSIILTRTMGTAFTAGYTLGSTVVEPLVRNYAPDLYNAIGGTISVLVDQVWNSWAYGVDVQGAAQEATAISYGTDNAMNDGFMNFGGDYGATQSWSESSGGGGGGCGPTSRTDPGSCPILQGVPGSTTI